MKEIPFYQTSIADEELEQLKAVLVQDKDSNKVLELEDNISNFVGAKYAIATCNATAAIHLALSAIKLKRGDKILMSVNSFVNVPEVVRHFDAEPIFIDINTEDMNIDIAKFEKALEENKTKKLRGAIITFVAGQTPDLDRIYDIAQKYGIILIEDATCALGVTYNDETVGSLRADMTIFSTNPSNGKYSEVMELLAAALIGIFLLLAKRYGVAHTIRIVFPCVVACLVGIAVTTLTGSTLNLFNLLALVLVVGIGIDYTLFFAEQAQSRSTLLAITLSAMTTLLSFGLLSLSETHAIHSFGLTTLSGIFVAWLLSPLAIKRQTTQ